MLFLRYLPLEIQWSSLNMKESHQVYLNIEPFLEQQHKAAVPKATTVWIESWHIRMSLVQGL